MTSAGPTVRSVTRSARGPVVGLVVFVLVVAGLALVSGSRRTGSLDPRAYDPAGTRALAHVLQDQGVPVQVVGTVDAVPAGSSLVLPFPDAMGEQELQAARALDGPLLVVAPGPESVAALDLDVAVVPGLRQRTLSPGCPVPAATRAGRARLGGLGFDGTGTGCYADDGRPSLYVEDGVVLVGSGDFLTNGHLDEDGNASLALSLVAPAPAARVAWLLPAAGTGDGKKGLLQLLPPWVTAALLQLGVAVVVLALWRSRRLGRVVPEPLPVVVRAAEAVEGRGRLYRTAGARDRAADALRTASRDAAIRRLGLGVGAAPPAVVSAAAERTGRPASVVQDLLYGPVPADDAALVRLADALARFDSEVL